MPFAMFKDRIKSWSVPGSSLPVLLLFFVGP